MNNVTNNSSYCHWQLLLRALVVCAVLAQPAWSAPMPGGGGGGGGGPPGGGPPGGGPPGGGPPGGTSFINMGSIANTRHNLQYCPC